ncbi:MAG: LicD family protein [Clostridiales bacterium]|jgi:lipopolysaccharide cholinephosphotransferase|nr:LicD family protein [Clostridiales bacterium]
MTALQQVELDILMKFAETANAEELTWYVMFGTLLGAVRNEGFIPWDVDIDVALPRSDYDRLCENAFWFKEPYFLQTHYNDPAAAPRFVRLRRSDTAVITNFPNGLTRGGNMGAYIDILPLDDVPNGETAKLIQRTVLKIQAQMLASAALDECEGAEASTDRLAYCYSAGGIAGCYDFFARRYNEFCSRYSNAPYYALPVLIGERGRRVFNKEWFSKSTPMNFEGIAVPAPIGWKEILIASYPGGIDEPDLKYRKAPRTANAVVDINRSYKEYIRRYTDMLIGTKGKKIMLFGAGNSLRIWLDRYGTGLDIICAFDNAETLWGSYAHGIYVRSPKDLPSLIDNGTSFIITSIHYEEIANQLESMDIFDYYIFIDGLKYLESV